LWQACSPAFKSYKANQEAEFQAGNERRAEEVLLLPATPKNGEPDSTVPGEVPF
jgi:hypothetical protein